MRSNVGVADKETRPQETVKEPLRNFSPLFSLDMDKVPWNLTEADPRMHSKKRIQEVVGWGHRDVHPDPHRRKNSC